VRECQGDDEKDEKDMILTICNALSPYKTRRSLSRNILLPFDDIRLYHDTHDIRSRSGRGELFSLHESESEISSLVKEGEDVRC
jgi:hypothetical protein